MYKKADNMLLNAANGLGLILADRLGIGADRYMSGVQTVNDTANNIRNGAASVGDYISDAGQAVSDAYSQYHADAANRARNVAKAVNDKISELKDKGAGIATQLEFVGDALADKAKNAVEKGKRVGKKVVDRAASTADAAVKEGKRVGKKVADRVSDAADDAIKAAPGVVNTVERTLADAGSDAAKTVGTAAGDAADFIREGVGGLLGPSEEELRKQRFKQLLMRYAPWTAGGALVGGVTGGLIGGKHKKTLLGSILGSVGGAGLATAGKYAYDKYMNKHASADYIDHRVRLKQKLQANYK